MAELKYQQIRNTELWQLFVHKCDEQHMGQEFILAVGDVCNEALDLSQYIIRFFPTFTLHNDLHSANVCRWMYILLGDMAEKLNAHEAAMLLMAACCHDIGMSVSDTQREEMCSRSYPGWDEYFARYLDDDEEYCKTNVISERMLRNYVRVNHHERIGENLKTWPPVLVAKGVKREDLLTICRSHGTDLERQKLKYVRGKYDMMLCAVLLRLADLLDYDAARAPEALFRHMGLEKPQTEEALRSADEFGKNQAGTFDDYIESGIIRYNAVYTDPRLEQDVQAYLDWVEKELDHCAENLCQTSSHWNELRLPHKISTEGVERHGYAAGKFHMTMDQDKVIELLAGKNLYPDSGVFVRELLQNSIDAVLMRVKQEKDFTLDQGRIIIDTWPGEAGDTWFRIRDNGTGMDEHIINNYFLKVGRSYYTSDEFRAANRRAVGGAYTAISRFGIGILSCFMTDPEHTELKVSTKRFGGRDRNGIRLDVTGLHGYYYLAHEAETSAKDDYFQQMPSPDTHDRGYRIEPGTTICVRTNLFRMGSTQSFREILDKYVQFPEVRVEYNGPEGHKEYTTQQELMDAVHALNPDGLVKRHVHEFSDEDFEELKNAFPIAVWKEKPAVVLTYHPLDWLSDSDKMTGVALSIDIPFFWVDCPEMKLIDRLGAVCKARAEIRGSVTLGTLQEITARFYLTQLNDYDYPSMSEELKKMPRTVEFVFHVEGMESILSENEQQVIRYLRESLCRSGEKHNFIAYNGVLAAENNPLEGRSWGNTHAALLLRENFIPEVDLARSNITRLPVEAACCFATMLDDWGGPYIEEPELLKTEAMYLLTNRELWDILDRHWIWEERIWKVISFWGKDSWQYSGLLRDRLRWAAFERKNSILFDFIKVRGHSMHRGFEVVIPQIAEKTVDQQTADFPTGMFAWPTQNDGSLAFVTGRFNIYNRMHQLSQWLIQNRAILEVKVRAVYKKLIRIMVLSHDKEVIRDTVNAILIQLHSFEGNCFGIHDGLFRKDEDFV